MQQNNETVRGKSAITLTGKTESFALVVKNFCPALTETGTHFQSLLLMKNTLPSSLLKTIFTR